MYNNKGEGAMRIVIKVLAIILIVLVIATAIVFCCRKLGICKNKDEKTTIITSSKLEKVLQISDLSTYKVTFNGVSTLVGDDGEQIGNVAYNAQVSVGMNMEDISVSVEDVDDNNKNIVVTLPEIQIVDTDVDPGSLDYMFSKKKYDSDNISISALPQCRQDAEDECNSNEMLFELARENAVNTIKALVDPLLDGMEGYTLVILDNEGNKYE